MEISIDTSTRYAGVALSQDGDIVREIRWHSRQNHTMELTGAVESVLEGAGATPRDLTTVFVALGPGGFSAVRAGLGFAKGLSEARDLPVVGVGTLAVEALPFAGLGRPVCPLLEVGRGQVAWALYESSAGDLEVLRDEGVTGPEAVLAAAPEDAAFCGEGAPGMEAVLRERFGGSALVLAAPPPPRQLWALARLGWGRFAQGTVDDRATLQPRYLRQPSITMPGGGRGDGAPGSAR